MAKARFSEEQIATILAQSKNSQSNKSLCEQYAFSVSTLRRWQEHHAVIINNELKQTEASAKTVFLRFCILMLVLALILPKPMGALALPPWWIYYVYYIRRFRAISAKHIKSENTYLSRTGKGGGNLFYQLSWAFLFLFILSPLYYLTTAT